MSNITTTSQDMFDQMEKAYKFAVIMAKSDIIPAHYRGKPENVFIAVQTAYRMNIDPMLVMQNTFTVSGKLGMNTSFAISLLNQSGLIKGTIKYKVEGENENLKVTASAIINKTDEEISATVGLKMAMAEGWTRNAKYKTMPEHMLKYRAATFLIRLHAPEVLNGLQTVEELEDVKAAEPRIVSHPEPTNEVPTGCDTKAAKLAGRLSSLVEIAETAKPSIPLDKDELIEKLTSLLTSKRIDEGFMKMCEKLEITSVLDMTEEQIIKAIEWAEQRQGD